MDTHETFDNGLEEIKAAGEEMERVAVMIINEWRHVPEAYAELEGACNYWGTFWAMRTMDEGSLNHLLDAGCKLYVSLLVNAKRAGELASAEPSLKTWAELMSQKPQRAYRLITELSR